MFRLGTDGLRFRAAARWSRCLFSAFEAFCRRVGLQASQVRFFLGGLLISPYDTPDGVGLEDGDLLVGEEVFEEGEEEEEEDDDEDSNEFCPCGCAGGTLPGTCRQGWGCTFAQNVNELHPHARG